MACSAATRGRGEWSRASAAPPAAPPDASPAAPLDYLPSRSGFPSRYRSVSLAHPRHRSLRPSLHGRGKDGGGYLQFGISLVRVVTIGNHSFTLVSDVMHIIRAELRMEINMRGFFLLKAFVNKDCLLRFDAITTHHKFFYTRCQGYVRGHMLLLIIIIGADETAGHN